MVSVWPTYQNLSKMKLVPYVVLLILAMIVPNAFAQSDDLSSVLKNAQDSLASQNKSNSPSTDQVLKLPPITIPKGSDIFVRTKLTYNKDRIIPTWEFPSSTTIYFSKGNKLCPQNNCLQEFQGGDLDIQGNDSMGIYGTLKIEDPLTSTAEFKNYKINQALGWAMEITKLQDHVKNKQTNYFFDGIFGFGEHEGTNQDVQYKVAGTFQIPSGKLEFSGKYGTIEELLAERARTK